MNDLPPADRPRVSLRRRFVWLLVGVVGFFSVGMMLSLVFSLQTNQAAETRLLKVEADQALANVNRRWDHYRVLLDNLARDPHLITLMRERRIESLRAWASERRSLFPGVYGLGLLDAEGELIGGVELPGIDPACLRDLRMSGADADAPVPVHRGSPVTAHFDLTRPVRDTDGVLLGRVFLSVRLSHLQRVIDDSTYPGHVISLIDAQGRTLASSGARQGAVNEIRLTHPETGWQIVAQSPLKRIPAAGWLQILAGMLTLVGVLVLLLVVVRRLRRTVFHDIQAGLDALTCLTRNESVPPIATRYKEFEHAVDDINRIAQTLQDQRAQLATLSLTDTLTGLPNRRAFETQFPQMLGMAARGHRVALILLDVDYFKRINDEFGHAMGDKALIALAVTLKSLTRSADLASRVAGDEFAVLLSGLDERGVAIWYNRLADTFQGVLRAQGLPFENTLSAGQTWLLQVQPDDMEKALARADHALYQAKARGRAQLVTSDAVRNGGAE